jgi:hypothetical protein
MKKLFCISALLLLSFIGCAQNIQPKKVYIVFEYDVKKTHVNNNTYAFYYIVSVNKDLVVFREAEYMEDAEQWYFSEKMYQMSYSKMADKMIVDSGPLTVKNNKADFAIDYSKQF